MNMKKPTAITTLLLATGLGLMSSLAIACPERAEGPRHHDGKHRQRAAFVESLERLSLTDAQKTAIKAIRDAAKPERETLLARLKESHQAIRQIQHTEGSSPDALRSALLAQVDLKLDLMTHGKRTREAIHAQLTPEQQAQWQALHAERRERHQQRHQR